MTDARQLASFVVEASFEDLTRDTLGELEIRVLDSLGCALGAIGGEPVRMLRAHTREFGDEPLCSLVGGDRTAPDRAAFCNGADGRRLRTALAVARQV